LKSGFEGESDALLQSYQPAGQNYLKINYSALLDLEIGKSKREYDPKNKNKNKKNDEGEEEEEEEEEEDGDEEDETLKENNNRNIENKLKSNLSRSMKIQKVEDVILRATSLSNIHDSMVGIKIPSEKYEKKKKFNNNYFADRSFEVEYPLELMENLTTFINWR
jgi:hypothetical protein